jgi:1-acyl-sn-glycerol-3-phosphate acyltransferase
MRTTVDRRGVAALQAWSRIAFYWTIKTVAWPVTRIYTRMRVLGGGNVPKRGTCIVVANHTSYADAVLLGSACPRRLSFMITRPIYRMKRLRWFYYMMGSIPVGADVADPAALKQAIRLLNGRDALAIFPEGQRMADGTPGAGKEGVALLAARTGAPVIPAAIIGAHGVMPVGAAFPRPRPVRVVFGPPLRFPAFEGRRPTRDQMREFAGQVMQAIRDLMDEPSRCYDRGDGVRTART